MEKIILSWSGGKDSAFALYHLMQQSQYQIVGLLTTVTEEMHRISIHGIREDILDAQAVSIKLPLFKVMIPSVCDNAVYSKKMFETLTQLKSQGVSGIAFGDLFLSTIRNYREQQLKQLNLKPIFPLWHRDTSELASQFLQRGFNAMTTCVDTIKLDASFVGRYFNHSFLKQLPSHVDPCGENREFHTCVVDGPIFNQALDVKVGGSIIKGPFCFNDVFF